MDPEAVDLARLPPTWNHGAIGVVVRAALVLLSLLSLWAAQGRYQRWRDDYSSTFRGDVVLWAAWLALVALAGVAFGLAVILPDRLAGYRWVRSLVLAALPLVLLVIGSLFLAPDVLRALPDFVFDLADLAYGRVFQPIAAFMLGIAVAAGFAEPRGAR